MPAYRPSFLCIVVVAIALLAHAGGADFALGQEVGRRCEGGYCTETRCTSVVPPADCRAVQERVCKPVVTQDCPKVDTTCRRVAVNQCRTVVDKSCATVQKKTCVNVRKTREVLANPKCVPTVEFPCPKKTVVYFEPICRTSPQQVCTEKPRQECQTSYRDECRRPPPRPCQQRVTQVCHDERRQVCGPAGKPRTECRTERIPVACGGGETWTAKGCVRLRQETSPPIARPPQARREAPVEPPVEPRRRELPAVGEVHPRERVAPAARPDPAPAAPESQVPRRDEARAPAPAQRQEAKEEALTVGTVRVPQQAFDWTPVVVPLAAVPLGLVVWSGLRMRRRVATREQMAAAGLVVRAHADAGQQGTSPPRSLALPGVSLRVVPGMVEAVVSRRGM